MYDHTGPNACFSRRIDLGSDCYELSYAMLISYPESPALQPATWRLYAFFDLASWDSIGSEEAGQRESEGLSNITKTQSIYDHTTPTLLVT